MRRVSLDSTSVVCGSRLHTPPAPTATAACQAGDDDAEEGDDGVDNGSAGGADGVDDGHEAVAYRAEDTLDLEALLARCSFEKAKLRQRTQDTTAPMMTVYVWLVVWIGWVVS